MMDRILAAHGGELVNLVVDEARAQMLRDLSRTLPSLTLNARQLSDLELLLNGAFSPLRGFMTNADYESVLDRMQLQNGLLWPLPICLDVSEAEARSLDAGQSVALRDVEGFMLAVLHVEDIWPIDKLREAEIIYGTTDTAHPGVDALFHGTGTHYVGGTVEGVQLPLHFAFKRLRHTPHEMRALFKKLGWRRIVGFQTRNPVHRAQFEMTLRAMDRAKANLLLHPVARRAMPGDIDYYTRIRCYQAVSRYYPPNMMLLSLLPLAMRLAGPREALLHALIRKNYGCTHFIVGRDHASPGVTPDGRRFYDPEAAVQTALEHQEALGIEIVPFEEEMVYVYEEDAYMPAREVPPQSTIKTMSLEEFHRRLREGKRVPEWFSFPEVIEELQRGYPPRHKQGFTIFCTGLSGAGKSTIARILYARLLEMGGRPVTLLDGDVVRRNLSSELGFSKEHRDINVRRIGFVASEITKNRGIAICAPIAPYAATRRQIRSLIEKYGGFVEVYVATPLEVCESRDRKGLYAKARAGLIKGFTGIDDPYEPPSAPEVLIDTTELTPDEAAQEVLLYLERAGYIK
ncbi:sulfate adenylyltransferase [Desulfosoma caldarium]|uniref:Adenylyl-sulfate kinase n=2 Tax=Desulfosoma caldarium TaxID=610254 RepID=A0A3N1UN23_9BACT|nr:bifunctional sulfate adenylyltransferase/adenylylsulfate kinase [Desulfosoma caldarium]ROQ91138.1 sulfate adenylyltransferase [Desulfosoma caldarium]